MVGCHGILWGIWYKGLRCNPCFMVDKVIMNLMGIQYGGEGGIRTLEGLRLTHFPGVLLRPLGHLTRYSCAIVDKNTRRCK